MVQRWFESLEKKESARQTFEAAQQEFNDYASDIIEVIGQPTYLHFLSKYLGALTAKTSTHG